MKIWQPIEELCICPKGIEESISMSYELGHIKTKGILRINTHKIAKLHMRYLLKTNVFHRHFYFQNQTWLPSSPITLVVLPFLTFLKIKHVEIEQKTSSINFRKIKCLVIWLGPFWTDPRQPVTSSAKPPYCIAHYAACTFGSSSQAVAAHSKWQQSSC